ncbi:hypothetical protein M409DRAFT_26869 [Zasmidium cellare ATCC 36951]|uniref:DUF3604 domain-containing protein n=1 Tax=Zasmidium cellare ATCC 36951 TaxID=1080233 RepID=A0A6A6C631_ZASCE|nr:uncharacterized protein M409DRAFT_26869 [Zasmidium cellare ATCC 36951]KAF2162627.1 hypothetical protein M409DRAFT_26869 [Zasmidium cellare ATCC 36951]
MKTLDDQQLATLAGPYFAPEGLYQYIKSLPFLGSIECDRTSLVAGEWTELLITYTVGGSGLADGGWIKGTFVFYSDWALFQTSSRTKDNYISAEYIPNALLPGQTPATVQSLSIRFDQKGHERPFQKAIIIDIVDGYLNPGDKILIRLGDRRWGGRGTRVQTFVEEGWRMRWYVDPVGTSRFARVKPDLVLGVEAGEGERAKVVSPRVARGGEGFVVRVRVEDRWGNVTVDGKGLKGWVRVVRADGERGEVWKGTVVLSEEGWTYGSARLTIAGEGPYIIEVSIVDHLGKSLQTTSSYLTIDSTLPIPRILFADLHVHSDDTVGTNSTAYNFSYAQHIAGLDIIGYTANDFNITSAAWTKTLSLIRSINKPGELVVYPGTEWCGNSAAGGDHNVVFLDDPQTSTPEFPLDRNGNVARSFEWNEDGPAELVPGAWPLDEVYATYAHAPESHLLIPHVGGRRCNLAWHHPQLERLLEVGSAWGHFEWLLQDSVRWGWKMGVCANSDEHRGRCGGGVPGTAVFGTKGGLTGVLAERLDAGTVARALRARRTFATTGERLVGLVSAEGGEKMQGDDLLVKEGEVVRLKYAFYGQEGFESIEAWDATGRFWHRNLRNEAASSQPVLIVKWGGARLYDRYREAVWDGTISISGTTNIASIKPFGGVLDVPEEVIEQTTPNEIHFQTRTSGDFDGVVIILANPDLLQKPSPIKIRISGTLSGYVKVGDPLLGNPHKPQPNFQYSASAQEAAREGGKILDIEGGVGLFVSTEVVADAPLPRDVRGEVVVQGKGKGEKQAVYFVGREWSGGKVITSPVFVEWE